MKTIRSALICMLAALLGFSFQAGAEDIDIYSNLDLSTGTPNLMFVIDSAANSDGSFGTGSCTYWDTSLPSLNGTKSLGNEQCALVNIVHNMPVRPDGTARINLGITTANGLLLPLTPIDDKPYIGSATLADLSGNVVTIPAGTTNKQAFMLAAKSYAKRTGDVAPGKEMQETWAYYTSGNKGANGSVNNTGSITGKTFTGAGAATTGCQHNYILTIGATPMSAHTANAAKDQDGASPYNLLTAVDNDVANKILTPDQGTALKTPLAGNTEYPWGIEWARYMFEADANTGAAGIQGITTYSVILNGGNASMNTFWSNVAKYGGGKPFTASTYDEVYNYISSVLNEVQAVNSVFASSSLPVSVNAQGTYLNQIYMGMFRPDASANPRWAGNLKQYSFYIDPIDRQPHLGDSLNRAAIDSAGTGFISAGAISYWTCSNPANPYLTTLNAAQSAQLSGQGQICASDPSAGFWARAPGMDVSAGKAFDLPDGNLVEKGGAAQQLRLVNLTDNYATAAGTATNPRKLYTYCPGGAVCNTFLTDPSNAFAVENAAITAGMFGANSVNISSIARSGTTVTVTTTGNHGFKTGDIIAINNASPGAYNGAQTVTVNPAIPTQFTYQITENPPTPATISFTNGYVVNVPAAPISVTQLARSGTTLTATTSAAHGYSAGNTVIITGSVEPQYNGTFTISGAPTPTTFTYALPSIKEIPPNISYGGQVRRRLPPSSTLYDIVTMTRPPGSTTVTVTTAAPHNLFSGMPVNIYGNLDAPPPAGQLTSYNGVGRTVTSIIDATTFTFTYPILASDPAVISPTVLDNSNKIQASSAAAIPIIIMTRNGSRATATTSAPHGITIPAPPAPPPTVSITATGAPPANQSAYTGMFPVLAAGTNTFDFSIVTDPITPATGFGGATMTATGGVPPRDDLISWVRGADNAGDEPSLCPPGSVAGANGCPATMVTVRPSVHGDVLHSRPTVINYGGQVFVIISTADAGGTRTATASAADVAKIGPPGAKADLQFIVSATNVIQTCTVTVDPPAIPGGNPTTFHYPATNCGDAGGQSVYTTTSNVMVYYGDNGGVFHAVNGNQVNPPGTPSGYPQPGGELWGFIPTEMFSKLNRQRTNSPGLELSTTPPDILPKPRPKDYFVDGPVGVLQWVTETGITRGAFIYLAMRRGGRLIYALDVSNPAIPMVKWKVDNSSPGMSELGQTWSQPKVAWVAGYPNPVLIFGAGYAPEEDIDPPAAADSMGRGIFVLDAFTGAVVWKATNGTLSPCAGACTVTGMDYSIPADITLVDRNQDGYIDRLYAADTGGNIWRVDLEPGGNSAPSNWRVYKLAALGCSNGPCAIPPGVKAQRKFFYPPEVITAAGYDAVIAGTGDREHPLYVDPDSTGTNQIVLLKDTYTGNDASGMTAITFGDLLDKTANGCLANKGYKISLGLGEKVVNAPLVTAGKVYLGTNQPVAPQQNACTSNLGLARSYPIDPFICNAVTPTEFAGGGMPPSPVSGIVNIVNKDGTVTQVPFLIGGGAGGDCIGSDCKSALGGQKPAIKVPTTRTRTYWYRLGK